MSTKRKKLVVVLGPTASGKSELALKLAKKYKGYIISADSRQIYKGMNIGTAKISKKEQKSVSHFMINIISPSQEYSLAQYQKEVFEIIKKQKCLPFLVGGTGLYISAIVDNLIIPKGKPDKALRKKLEKKSLNQLFKQLEKLDPEAAQVIDKNNKRRLIRALEVCLITQKPFSSQKTKGKPLFDILQIGIKIPREKLYQKINKRVDKMIEKGLISEVKRLGKKYGFEKSALSGIGYKQIGLFLQGKLEKEEVIDLIKKDTRNYAKRQLTWFKRDKRIKWVKNQKEAQKLISGFLNN